jgi:redox-sensitive bicupin YhaK (pirin superfamily)
MITLRPSSERGHANHGWLDTYHTFSFDTYRDPNYMGFRTLRVINEDRVAPGRGFPTHPHRDMEIITYILQGALAHQDSMGNGSVIRPGDVQRMSAGTGVRHSEFNHSPNEPVHLLQIWILPRERGIAPSYEQKMFAEDEKLGRLRLIASSDGREGSVTIHQDASIYTSLLKPGSRLSHELKPGRHAWIQAARGAFTVNGVQLRAGDGAAISDERQLTLASDGTETSELLLFDLA